MPAVEIAGMADCTSSCYFAAPALRLACSAELPAGPAGMTPVFVDRSESEAAAPELLLVLDVEPAVPELRAA
jgi:hypothetical protein